MGTFADCTPIYANYTTSGFKCGGASTYQKASYALNQFYQSTSQNSSNCEWDGLAQVTSIDPSFGDCFFQRALDISRIEQLSATLSKFSVYVLIYVVSLVLLLSSFL